MDETSSRGVASNMISPGRLTIELLKSINVVFLICNDNLLALIHCQLLAKVGNTEFQAKRHQALLEER